ncbi:MAG: hypothetical protein IJ302_00110 [Clostridia bacterium]|nr:hypothetical protein [Clostridia bacterium]
MSHHADTERALQSASAILDAAAAAEQVSPQEFRAELLRAAAYVLPPDTGITPEEFILLLTQMLF